MARMGNLKGGVFLEVLPAIPKVGGGRRKARIIMGCGGNKSEETQQQQSLKASTRRRMGMTLLTLVGTSCGIGKCLADDNGFWLNGPLPLPSVNNKIANEETGTRSFLKKGVYIADIGTKGRQYRVYKYAFDLLALGDLIGADAFSYVRKYLRLKSTFMYYDFDKLISAASINDKQPLTDLANRLFDTVEKLEDAVKEHNLSRTQSYYEDTTAILQEVMTKMA